MVLVVECKADRALVKILTSASKRNLIHGGNKTGVLEVLLKARESSTGVIDEDPWSPQPPNLRKFKMKQDVTRHNFKIMQQTGKNISLIMLCPRLEEWILRAANEARVSPNKYGLPYDAAELRKQITAQTDKFEKFVKAIKDRSKRIEELQKHLLSKPSSSTQ
jgi:hypothetical protein